MKYYLLLLPLILLLTTCEGYTEANGIVVDDDTNQPLDSVLVGSWAYKINDHNFESEILTDSTGKWWATTGLVGCGCNKCADLVVQFSRQGYETLILENPQDSIVFLKKE